MKLQILLIAITTVLALVLLDQTDGQQYAPSKRNQRTSPSVRHFRQLHKGRRKLVRTGGWRRHRHTGKRSALLPDPEDFYGDFFDWEKKGSASMGYNPSGNARLRNGKRMIETVDMPAKKMTMLAARIRQHRHKREAYGWTDDDGSDLYWSFDKRGRFGDDFVW